MIQRVYGIRSETDEFPHVTAKRLAFALGVVEVLAIFLFIRWWGWKAVVIGAYEFVSICRRSIEDQLKQRGYK